MFIEISFSINMNSEETSLTKSIYFFRFLSLLLYLCCRIYLYLDELPDIYQDLQLFCCCKANLLLFHILIVKS